MSLIKDKILSLSIVCSFFEPSIHFLSIQELGVHLKGMIYTLINIYLISEEVETQPFMVPLDDIIQFL